MRNRGYFFRVVLIKSLFSFFFIFQVQAFLNSLVEEEQEEVKKELIFIKNIFIKQEEEEGGDEEEKEEGEGQSKDNGDLSSQLHCSTSLCE